MLELGLNINAKALKLNFFKFDLYPVIFSFEEL
jgi:hypothetical protein